jgi:hypothetical protein
MPAIANLQTRSRMMVARGGTVRLSDRHEIPERQACNLKSCRPSVSRAEKGVDIEAVRDEIRELAAKSKALGNGLFRRVAP